MTILEKIKFEEDWLSEVNLTKENIKIAFAGIRATALEQQPCEDCVSRQAVLDIWHTTYSNVRTENEEIQYKKIAYELPSVTPSKHKGKWIQTKDDCDGVNFYDFSFECSKCGKEQSFKSNYCPSCGADMRGDNENLLGELEDGKRSKS